MKQIHQGTAGVLQEKAGAILASFAEASIASHGDFSQVEQAAHTAILKLRGVMLSAGLTFSSDESRQTYHCPTCKAALHGWVLEPRRVVTSEGEATYRPVRYRCGRCQQDHYPLEEANGLSGSQFTTGAQGLIGEAAAQTAFGHVSRWLLSERALPVSAKEVDRTARDVSEWRAQEEELLCQAVFGEEAARQRADGCDPLAATAQLGIFGGWSERSVGLMSVDGAMVRSPEKAEDGGLAWFEHRAGVIAPARDEDPGEKTYIAGVCAPDELFDLMSAVMRKGAQSGRPLVFVADGSKWIWDRVRLYFPTAVQVLDVYHAAEHVASGAYALWGEGSEETLEWRKRAREMLIEPAGPQRILRVLLKGLKEPNSVADAEALRREIAYLFGHRHRMKYHALKQQDLPIGSGAMESAIKQLNVQRLKLPGMKWTREGADAILRLRAAHLSGTFAQTVKRRHDALQAKLQRYTMTA
jgi:hypothetical protein